MKTSLSCICALAVLLLAGCQPAGSANNTWRRPGYYGAPKRSVAVAVLAYRNEVRAEYENALVAALHARGVDAKATYPLLSTQEIISNKDAAVARAKSLGVEGVLAIRLADKKTLEIYQMSPSNSGDALRPWQGWYDFFGIKSAYATRPEMIQPGSVIGVTGAFFESPSGTLLWSAALTPRVGGSATKPNAFAGAVTLALQRAALIP
jgi:hypothetical protein